MKNMKIFPKEIEAGLSDKITASSKASANYDVITTESEAEKAVANIIPGAALTRDLMLVHGILVTTNWNKNDDVFSPEEVLAAKDTPVFKPTNINHRGEEGDNQNIGVICSAILVDDAYNKIDIAVGQDSIPSKFHIMCGMYLWEKYFPMAVNEIKESIDRNQMYISMECLFDDFGYALKGLEDDDITLVARNEQTCVLSSHLRIYGGTGQVDVKGKKFKIGRWLRKITFSGVGFVKKPANPESVVFDNYVSFAKASWEEIEKFDISEDDGVLTINKGLINLWPKSNQI